MRSDRTDRSARKKHRHRGEERAARNGDDRGAAAHEGSHHSTPSQHTQGKSRRHKRDKHGSKEHTPQGSERKARRERRHRRESAKKGSGDVDDGGGGAEDTSQRSTWTPLSSEHMSPPDSAGRSRGSFLDRSGVRLAPRAASITVLL